MPTLCSAEFQPYSEIRSITHEKKMLNKSCITELSGERKVNTNETDFRSKLKFYNLQKPTYYLSNYK
jgi:hypothetical protein